MLKVVKWLKVLTLFRTFNVDFYKNLTIVLAFSLLSKMYCINVYRIITFTILYKSFYR